MRRKRMAQRVWTHGLDNARLPCRGADCALQDNLLEVMTPVFTGARVYTDVCSGKHPLPASLAIGVGVFPLQGVWQIHAAEAADEVVLMQVPHLCQMSRQRRFYGNGQHRHTIFVALTFPDN